MAEKAWILGFIVVFLAGAYLRFRGLTFQSYWDDELFSVAISDPNHALREVIGLTVSDVHPPLFQVLLWCWFKLFGFSEMSGRLFPAIWGVLSIPVMFLLGREVGDRKTGFICALICAFNIYHLHYAQEVRSYSLLFFLSALSLLFFMRVIHKPRKGNLIAYIVAATALAYTHFFGLFVLMAQAVFFLFARMSAGKEFKSAGIVIGIALLIALSPLVPLVGFAEIADGVSQAMALLVFAILSLLLIFHQPPYYRTVTKPQIREAAQALMAVKPDPDQVYAAPEVVRNFNIYFALFNAPFRVQSADNLYRDLSERRRAPGKFWLIDGRTGGPVFKKRIGPKVRVLEKTDFRGAGFRLMELEE